MIKVAHRGASAYELENSLSAFKKAINLGIDFIEFDIQTTSDNKFVVFHDETLDRCTNSSGFIKSKTFNEIRTTVKLNNGEVIPSLKEVCEFLGNYNIRALIELKNDNVAEQVSSEVSKILNTNSFIIGSFFHNQIKKLKDSKNVLTCVMFEAHPIDLSGYLKYLNVDYAAFGLDSSSKRLVDEIKESGAIALAWTANTPDDIAKCKQFQVDGIISNNPDLIDS